jgi:hypothetical protein
MITVYDLIGNKEVRNIRKPLFIGSCRITKLERVNSKIIATLNIGGTSFLNIVTEDTIVRNY